jgi:hypothetical protein
MAQNSLPQIPMPGNLQSPTEINAYIRQLYSVLSRWQLLLNSTKFLGSASGHLTISDVAPTSADGEDEDIWVKH